MDFVVDGIVIRHTPAVNDRALGITPSIYEVLRPFVVAAHIYLFAFQCRYAFYYIAVEYAVVLA